MWSQAAVLGSLGFVHSTAAAARHLTVAGRGTPLLFNILEVLEDMVLGVGLHFRPQTLSN